MTICQHCGKQTTNNDNQTSLLAYLAYKKFTAQTQALQIETIATEALGYILSRVPCPTSRRRQAFRVAVRHA